jgi:hypothetical protein
MEHELNDPRHQTSDEKDGKPSDRAPQPVFGPCREMPVTEADLENVQLLREVAPAISSSRRKVTDSTRVYLPKSYLSHCIGQLRFEPLR